VKNRKDRAITSTSKLLNVSFFRAGTREDGSKLNFLQEKGEKKEMRREREDRAQKNLHIYLFFYCANKWIIFRSKNLKSREVNKRIACREKWWEIEGTNTTKGREEWKVFWKVQERKMQRWMTRRYILRRPQPAANAWAKGASALTFPSICRIKYREPSNRIKRTLFSTFSRSRIRCRALGER